VLAEALAAEAPAAEAEALAEAGHARAEPRRFAEKNHKMCKKDFPFQESGVLCAANYQAGSDHADHSRVIAECHVRHTKQAP
jgi:hypothetical protein